MYGNAAQAYQAQQVRGVSRVEQVALLYDRAIASLREAIQAIEDRQIERRWKANKRAQDIVFALYSALDPEHDGELGQNLDRLHRFVLQRLPQVDLRSDPEPAREAIEVLAPLRDSWHELARREAAGDPAPATRPERAADGDPPAAETGLNETLDLQG